MRFHETTDRFREFARRSRDVVVLAALTGACTGLGVALFERIVVDGLLDRVFELPAAVLAFLPLVGLTIAWLALRFVARSQRPATADAYLLAFHDPEQPLRLREVPGRMLAAVATLGAGGAMGMEGPSLYLGSSIGTLLERRFPRMTQGASRRVLLVAGAAAGVAAIFKAPATGAVFALEVPYQDDLARRMLLPALVSSATSYLVFVAINGTAPLLSARGNAPFTLTDLAAAIGLGAAAGLCARAFAWLIRWAKELPLRTPPILHVLVGGLGLAAIFALAYSLTDQPVTLGVGYNTIEWAATEHAIWLLLVILVLRCLATAATVAGGGVGGLFVPLVVAGALLGRVTAEVVGDARGTLFVIIGVAAFLGAGYRVPLAAVMFVAEASGRPGFVVPALLAAVAASLVMGRSSVTTYQRATLADASPETETGEPPGPDASPPLA